MAKTIGIGLIGLGTVGSGVVQLLRNAPSAMRRRKNVGFELRGIAVRDVGRQRSVDFDHSLLTADGMAVVDDPGVEMVVELTGASPAVEWVRAALKKGKDVVTANKAMLADYGEELYELALENGADLMFEASVAGGIPIIRSLRNGLVANRVESLYGILNGTTNYILTQMTRGAGDYADILELAQEKGFAEPDPTMDVSGMDAAQKLSILCRIAFHSGSTGSQIFCEGIEKIERRDIEYAGELGYVIKLLAIAKKRGDRVEARVHPAMVPADSLLANIHDEFNAIEVVGSAVGEQVFYGRGAGQMPTASAVVSDMVYLA
ncbi:MAG: homoserine dehydrogenase, partial [Gemmatimonadetes bacterium]|nr:homoserine dehydrogenase [Gemmatimonadota bacterium]